MESINECTFSGNIATDPDLRLTKSGFAILTFRLAVTNSKKVGEKWEEVPMFLDCKMFGRRAESVSKFLTKGAFAVLSGSLWLNEWEKDGEKHKTFEVHAEKLVVRDSKPKTEPNSMEVAGIQFYEEDVPF